MSNLTGNQHRTGNQDRTAFILGQLAESVGNYFVRIKRNEIAREEYEEAIEAYKWVSTTSPEYQTAQKNLTILLKKWGRISIIDLFSSLAGEAVDLLKQGWAIVKDSVPRTETERAFRSPSEKKVLGIKKSLDLGKTQVTLTIKPPEKTMQEGTEQFNIMLVIDPTDSQSVLPDGLWIKVFDGPQVLFDQTVEVEKDKRAFPLLNCSKGEQFSVQLSLDEASVIEHFEV